MHHTQGRCRYTISKSRQRARKRSRSWTLTQGKRSPSHYRGKKLALNLEPVQRKLKIRNVSFIRLELPREYRKVEHEEEPLNTCSEANGGDNLEDHNKKLESVTSEEARSEAVAPTGRTRKATKIRNAPLVRPSTQMAKPQDIDNAKNPVAASKDCLGECIESYDDKFGAASTREALSDEKDVCALPANDSHLCLSANSGIYDRQLMLRVGSVCRTEVHPAVKTLSTHKCVEKRRAGVAKGQNRPSVWPKKSETAYAPRAGAPLTREKEIKRAVIGELNKICPENISKIIETLPILNCTMGMSLSQ